MADVAVHETSSSEIPVENGHPENSEGSPNSLVDSGAACTSESDATPSSQTRLEDMTVAEEPATLQVMNNHELAQRIILLLCVTDDAKSEQKTTWKRDLLPLLGVSSGLFHVAAEILWDTMHSMLPLFRLLPAFQEKDTGYVSKSIPPIALKDFPDPVAVTDFKTLIGVEGSDWSRFQLYANFIRCLDYQEGCPLEALQERWLLPLLSKSARNPLMQTLRSVHLANKARGVARLLPITMGPALRELSVALKSPPGAKIDIPEDWDGNDDDAEGQASALMAHISYLAQDLENLSYLGPTSKYLLQSFHALAGLTSLSLTITNTFKWDNLAFVAQMSALQSLELVLLKSCKYEAPKDWVRPRTNLPNLTHFAVIGGCYNLLSTLFIIRPTQLKHFKASVTHVDYNDINQGLRYLLARNHELETFNVHVPNGIALRTDKTFESHTQEGNLNLLSKITTRIRSGNLREITITGLPLFDKETVKHVRWSCLERLRGSQLRTFRFHIPTAFSSSQEPGWHANSNNLLYHIAFHGCHTPEHLELQFLDSCFSTTLQLPPGISTHGLKTLGIVTDATELELSMQQKVDAANYINVCFLRLERVWGTAVKDWQDVDFLIQTFKTNRKMFNAQPYIDEESDGVEDEDEDDNDELDGWLGD